MSSRLLQEFLHPAGNLLLFETEIGTINSVPLICIGLSNSSVFIRNTYCLDEHNILVNLVPNDNLFEIIDLVNELLALSGGSWLSNNFVYKLTSRKALDVISEQKVKEYSLFIEDDLLPEGSILKAWNFMMLLWKVNIPHPFNSHFRCR